MLDSFSVAQRMKWASKRTTTREEDIAYCLMGLFDVNMPLLYGEGPKAFYRLQEAILELSSDHSILAFRSEPQKDVGKESALLAPHPVWFRDEVHNMRIPGRGTHTSLSGTSLSIDMLICELHEPELFQGYLGILDCSIDGDQYSRPALLLLGVDSERLIFRRRPNQPTLYRLRSTIPTVATLMTDKDCPEKCMSTQVASCGQEISSFT
jgi:hypothetical protein